MKPKLPPEIESKLPAEILQHIYSFVPHLPKEKPHFSPITKSPQLDKELKSIQQSMKSNKNTMYMKDLEEYVLD